MKNSSIKYPLVQSVTRCTDSYYNLEKIMSLGIDAQRLLDLYAAEMATFPDEDTTIVQTLPNWCLAGYCGQDGKVSQLRIQAESCMRAIKTLSHYL